MPNVTIEGSKMPAAGVLKRGERQTVQLTPRIERLIERGFVVEISREVDEAQGDGTGEAAPPVEDEVQDEAGTVEDTSDVVPSPPARNASRKEWAAFLTDTGFDVPEDKTRDQLVAAWSTYEQQVSGGS